ncbi:MAG: PAS domain-containing protein [Rubrivivax sp.]|nr:PAS domain-containing protein [Rubrivivax sp.]
MTRHPERRQGDRRQGDRRQEPRREPGRPFVPPSTAGAGSAAEDAASGMAPEGPSTLTAALGGDFDSGDSTLLSREARRVAHAPGGALARIVRTYAAARVAVGVTLVGAQVVTSLLGVSMNAGAVTLCLLYAVQATLLWLLPSLRELTSPTQGTSLRRRQWLATIGVDLVAFGLLHVLDAGASFNYAALLVLPVLMSGVLTPRLVALGTAAGVALLLLGVTLKSVATSGEGAIVLAQSGLAGMGLFVIALMAGEMASRLVREQLAARGSLEIARQQAQLNRLVIEEMADGVLVLDRRLRVRAANPAARRLLVATGFAPAAPFALRELPGVQPLCELVERAMAEERWPDAGLDVQLVFSDSARRSLRMRVRFTRGALAQAADDETAVGRAAAAMPEGLCVVLLEDVRTAVARLRQEKLAAMGRVSAGIAHEFRNPLAAIAQANALLLEEPLEADQARLGRMVADNVRRLQRIVDDVLEAARGPSEEPPVIDARALVESAVAEWARTAGIELGEQAPVKLDLPGAPLGVRFDAEHLRRVLVNLLDNALRHSTRTPHAVVLRLAPRDEGSAVLALASDGAPIAADVEPHLFEPFFSTRSRGSGLGLYICRELCERYGASIEFRARAPNDRHRNGFLVLLRRGALPAMTAAESER